MFAVTSKHFNERAYVLHFTFPFLAFIYSVKCIILLKYCVVDAISKALSFLGNKLPEGNKIQDEVTQ